MPNTATLTGLSPVTAHNAECLVIDDWGNETIHTIGVFTTLAAAAPGSDPVRLLATPYADSSNASATHTTLNVTPTGGRPVVIVVHMQAGVNGQETVSAATFGGADVTPAVAHQFDGGRRAQTLFFVINNPSTSAQAFEITFANTSRSVLIEILEIPGGATTATVGNVMSGVSGTDTSATITGTTGTNGSLVLYAITRRYNGAPIIASGVDGNLSQQDSGQTSRTQDVETMIAWETVASAGASSAVFDWDNGDDPPTLEEQYAVAGIEIKAA